jgi:membrane-bound ClpP family serine protease
MAWCQALEREAPVYDAVGMAALALILLIVGVVLLLLGIFVEAVKFLLWVGAVILILAIIAWLMRFIRRQT